MDNSCCSAIFFALPLLILSFKKNREKRALNAFWGIFKKPEESLFSCSRPGVPQEPLLYWPGEPRQIPSGGRSPRDGDKIK